MKNFTRLSGGTLKLRCEVKSNPPATDIRWFRNEMALTKEGSRVRIRTKIGNGETQWSRVRIKPLDTMDTGFYRCQASNGKRVISAESMVKVTKYVDNTSFRTSHFFLYFDSFQNNYLRQNLWCQHQIIFPKLVIQRYARSQGMLVA